MSLLEATYGWEWLAELLEEAGYDLHLAHPLRTRAIAAARVKTDAIDAKTLAHLLRTGFLPEAYVAPRELRDLRELLRHRATLTRMRSAVKNRVHAILAKHGIAQRALRPVRQRRPRVPRRARAARRAAPAAGQPDLADLRLRPRDRGHHPRDRAAREGRRPRRRADPDPRCRALHRDADHRRDRRHHPLPDRPAPVLLGRTGAERAQLRRQSPPRAHHPPGLARAALGAGRGRAEDHHRIRTRCARSSSGSPNAAGARSPRSRSPARSSPCPTTACATERSVA